VVKPKRNYLSYDLIHDITQCYRVKLLWVQDTLPFGDESEECDIKGWKNPKRAARILDQLSYFFLNQVPRVMKKMGLKPYGLGDFSMGISLIS